ncbi:dTDP-glucose 4,6-dehydratase [Strigomonas culicis]|uniref:dTDP-glucose 4,6-dehydratase n=1 Tax=Strigomonas culicis TaxID=28005 RepID=S9WJ60_9TRYP|nr:dTDP-glucose 4,6-dehydratase [Strigomonas culicis]|eukprot:EPY35950.1 dTDP-glucose 4,6-dehydratase [Strigomonas culicis]
MFRKAGDENTIKTRQSGDARPLKNLLVTGGCGFIGANFINRFMRTHPTVHVYNLDKLEYCSNLRSIEHADSPYYHFVRGDITNRDLVMHIFVTYDIDTVVHFAAQSHVDNSFGNSLSFTMNNVYGTHNLLECARVYNRLEKFIHVSTDEVYGEVKSSQFEEGMLNPTNPYAATKAAAEYIVKSYHISFNLPVLISRGNNVYGPYQYPEKIIPRFIMLLERGERLTVQGTGHNTRTFIHAFDVADAFSTLVDKGVIGEIYNIGSTDEHSVMEIARRVVSTIKGPSEIANEEEFKKKYIAFVKDREFNDERYDIDCKKLEALGWTRQYDFQRGFVDTVEWYVEALRNHFWSDIKLNIPDSTPLAPPVGGGSFCA